MKTLAKKIVALILAVGLCFALCSCDALGSSDAQGYYKDETKNEIVFDNNTYKMLEAKIEDDILVNVYNSGTICKEGTPAVFAAIIGDGMSYNDQKTIIELIDDDLNFVYYCREDVYDEITQRVKNLVLDYFCYTTFDDDAKPEDHALDDDMAAAVEEIVSSQTPKKEDVSSEKFVSLYKCDKEMTFHKEYVDVDLLDSGKYVITSYDVDYNTLVYEIPAEKLDIFKTLVDTYGTEVSLW